MNYQIFADVTSDLSDEMLSALPHIEILPMDIEIDGDIYTYGPSGNLSIKEFYKMQRAGKFAKTSQVTPETFKTSFEPYLKDGKDILYLGFSSGMSGTMNSANLCARELGESYPERKIICIDTLCGSVGEAFLIYEAAKRQAEGMSLDELADWILESRLKICHWFTVDTFQHLLHGGRVSAVAAMAGTVLNIKPLLHIDEEGKLQVTEKPRGNKQALKTKLQHMEQGWTPEYSKLVVIGHGDAPEHAEVLKEAVAAQFPEAEIYISDIGPVIGAHTGPGMVALIYWGDNR